jgi:cyclohexanone monooxygenase
MQRTPGHSVPAGNRSLHPGEQEAVKARYGELRKAWNATPGATAWRTLPTDEVVVTGDKSALTADADERRRTFQKAWDYGGTTFHRAFNDLLTNVEASKLANEFIREKIAETVKDPVTAEKLTPRQLYGTKRLILDSGYYQMFNKPNVELVDVREAPIEAITETGIRTKDALYEVDIIVLATGYDALTGSLLKLDITGRGGRKLKDAWEDGPVSYLGMAVVGFPNLFIVAGPGAPAVLANVIVANEHQVGWIADCITWLDKHHVEAIEAQPDAQTAWVAHVNEVGAASIYTKGDSWYLGANIAGKPRVFMPYIGFPRYVEKCATVAENGYEGFTLTRQKAQVG